MIGYDREFVLNSIVILNVNMNLNVNAIGIMNLDSNQNECNLEFGIEYD